MALFRKLSAGAEKNHKRLYSREPISEPRHKLGISRTQSWTTNHWTKEVDEENQIKTKLKK
jgi:hypothetical protein